MIKYMFKLKALIEAKNREEAVNILNEQMREVTMDLEIESLEEVK